MTRQGLRLKRPGKGIALAIAMLVGALIIGWSMREPDKPAALLVLHASEKLKPQEIAFREIIGKPSGAPDDFECLQVYDVRPMDPAMEFSERFTLNFSVKPPSDAIVALLVDGKWVEQKASITPEDEVTASVRGTKPGTYALGYFR